MHYILLDFSHQNFYKDGKNGSYYAKFYTTVASRIKNSWPDIKLGGPVIKFTNNHFCHNETRFVHAYYHRLVLFHQLAHLREGELQI